MPQVTIVVFVISAILHEVLVSVPLHMFQGWFFLAMIMQVPFAFITDRFVGGTVGGWLAFVSSIHHLSHLLSVPRRHKYMYLNN